jgi:hypothetical protein
MAEHFDELEPNRPISQERPQIQNWNLRILKIYNVPNVLGQTSLAYI